MTLRIFAVLILIAACSACCALTGKDIKGVYVTGWTGGAFTKAEVDATLNGVKEMGATDVFLQVRKYDDAMYDTALVKKVSNVAAGFDPLGYALKKAHSMGLRIHAWLVICRIDGPDYKTTLTARQQGWLALMENGQAMSNDAVYIDPAVPAAREYLCSVVRDVLTRYKVDGIHWDYIRYASKSYSYSGYSRALFYKEYGMRDVTAPEYSAFRRHNMNLLARDLRDAVRSVNKTVPISAATITWGGMDSYESSTPYVSVFQDYREWLKQGYIDIAMPMLYKREENAEQKRDFRRWLASFAEQGKDTQFAVTVSDTMNDPEDAVEQIKLIKKAGYGWCIFAFNDNEYRQPIKEAVKKAGL
ncbi:MAG: family 10 glycosylhydrolase [Abditibacteriota bacterium]|nr:family 10 glycosylhydrolase [Abditibacteriota bacterium]